MNPWWAVALVYGAYLTIFLHELSHLLVAFWYRAEVKCFKVWPTHHEGRFVLGLVNAKFKITDPDRRRTALRLFFLAPVVKACVMIFVWMSLMAVSKYTIVLALCEFVDYIYWPYSWDAGMYKSYRK